MKTLSTLVALALTVAAPSLATPVAVTILGTVEYNQVTIGQFAGVNPGDLVTLSFMLDSDNYVDGVSFPTRAYVIDQGSFQLTMGPAIAHLHNPFPGTPYFVVRNDDPAVDGFFLSTGTDLPVGLELDEPANLAGTRHFQSMFYATYSGTTLSSLDILAALGTYGLGGLTVYGFAIEDLGFQPIGLVFDSMTISSTVAVEETTWGAIKGLYR